jgi:hypothetical protein
MKEMRNAYKILFRKRKRESSAEVRYGGSIPPLPHTSPCGAMLN